MPPMELAKAGVFSEPALAPLGAAVILLGIFVGYIYELH